MSNVYCKNNSEEKDSKIDSSKCFLSLLGIFVVCSIFGLLAAAVTSSDNNDFARPSNSIINEYKTSRQTLVNNYNSLLSDAKKGGKSINVNDFNNNDEISFENYCGNDIVSKVGKAFCKKLHKRLVNSREALTNKLKSVNNDMSNNIKIDYSSLKITNNIKDDNEVRPLIQEYVKNYQSANKGDIICCIGIFATFLIAAIVFSAFNKSL